MEINSKLLKLFDENELSIDGDVFMGRIQDSGGMMEVVVHPENLQIYLTDRDLFAAEYFGASKPAYQNFIATRGRPRCSALNGKGDPCQVTVGGRGQRSFKEWFELDGGLCKSHGRATRSEDRADRAES